MSDDTAIDGRYRIFHFSLIISFAGLLTPAGNSHGLWSVPVFEAYFI